MACGSCGNKSRQLNNNPIQSVLEVAGTMDNKSILDLSLKISAVIDAQEGITGQDVRKIMGVVGSLYPMTPVQQPKPAEPKV